MQQMLFIADFIACLTCFGHHYAHHQKLEIIIQMVAACGICVQVGTTRPPPQSDSNQRLY